MIFIGIVGLLNSLVLFVCSIVLFCHHETWFGLLGLFEFAYVLTFTVVMWKNDIHVKENQEKIKCLDKIYTFALRDVPISTNEYLITLQKSR